MECTIKEVQRQIEQLPLLHASYIVRARGIQISSDDPRLVTHYETRLCPFRVATTPPRLLTRAILLTRPEHSARCGLIDVEPAEQTDSWLVWHIEDKSCTVVISRAQGIVVLAARTGAADIYWMVEYLAEILPGFMLGEDTVALHSSGARTPYGAVAFGGSSGTGKTTLAIYMSQFRDCAFLADDKLVLSADADGLVRAHPLYSDLHFAPTTVALLPFLAERTCGVPPGRDMTGLLVTDDPDEQDEVRVAITTLWPAWVPQSAPLTAVIFPNRVPGQPLSRLVPLSTERARDLLHGCLQSFASDHWPRVAERGRRILRMILEQCRCWQLNMGSDLSGLREVIESATL